MSRRSAATAALLAIATSGALLATGCGQESTKSATTTTPEATPEAVLTPGSVDPAAAAKARRETGARKGGSVVSLNGSGGSKTPTYAKNGISPGAPTDAQVKTDLKEARAQLSKFKAYLGSTAYLQTGPRAAILADGTAVAPDDAPEPVQRVIQAANAIAKTPYKWGGGHGAWRDNGYDCSGSVSFALAGAGLLHAPMTSGDFMTYGDPGVGKWITIFANEGHIFMYVAGLRFDTSGANGGTRWQKASRSTAGFAVRHQPGL